MDKNIEISDLSDLYAQMIEAEKRGDHKLLISLYDNFFIDVIKNEGFNCSQASIISFEAYERGHSAGYTEVVSVAMGIVEFSKRLIKAK